MKSSVPRMHRLEQLANHHRKENPITRTLITPEDMNHHHKAIHNQAAQLMIATFASYLTIKEIKSEGNCLKHQ